MSMVLDYTKKIYDESLQKESLIDPASYGVLILRLVNKPLVGFNPEVFLSEV